MELNRNPLIVQEGKALADFIAGAGGSEKAFVEQKFLGEIAGEGWLALNFRLQLGEFSSFAFAARQRDVRLVGARLGSEAAEPGCRADALLKQEQLRREPDRDNQDSGAGEELQLLKCDGNRGQMQLAEPRGHAFVLFRAGIAEKLQSDVPRFRRCPAQPVVPGFQPRRERREFAADRNRQGNPDKEAHTKIVQEAGCPIHFAFLAKWVEFHEPHASEKRAVGRTAGPSGWPHRRWSSTLSSMEVLYGLHPVEEAVKAGRRRFDQVLVARERDNLRLERLVVLCRQAGLHVRQEAREQLTQLAQSPAHQGVVALVHPLDFLSIEDLFEPARPEVDGAVARRLLLALDGVEDPQNLGALLRVADGAGVDGVVLTERRSAPLSPVAVKASAGATEHLRIARVVNLVRALEELKRRNLWIIGLDERGQTDYDQFDLTGDCVLVLGREGAGLHDLVRRTCDHLLRIPMSGGVSSLNVSAAGAVVLFEAFRQRRLAARRTEGAVGRAAGAPAAAAASKPKKQKGLGS
jgi:23S rRNA (guanosine2251-2'-O)-methyltransferase